MNRVICIKGHFYDGDKYDACPHCAAGAEAIRQDPFSVRHSELENEKRTERGNEGKPRREKGGIFHRRGKRQQEEAIRQEAVEPTDGKAAEPIAYSARGTVLLQAKVEAEMPLQKEMSQQRFEHGSEQISEQKESASQSLSAIFAASAQVDEEADEGKTVGYFSGGKTELPVGYLICTAGEDYGMGFPLKAGNNSIGRSVSMDVVITDEKVSREKQAFVMYEPLKREFYIKPGEGTGLCYLNDELVLGPVRINAFDRILLGNTKLMLVPVCCERFSWEEKR